MKVEVDSYDLKLALSALRMKLMLSEQVSPWLDHMTVLSLKYTAQAIKRIEEALGSHSTRWGSGDWENSTPEKWKPEVDDHDTASLVRYK